MNAGKNEPWTADKFERWYREQPVVPSRDYAKTLVPRIMALGEREGFTVEKYGSASYATDNGTDRPDTVTHDLFRILVGDFDPDKPTYFVLGGTHGYEKGGPLAALGFAEEEAAQYAEKYNIVIYPCLCPGPYEKELRFTQGRIDPNRDALLNGARSQEMQALAESVKELHARMFGDDLTKKFTAAIDLHETPKKDIAINMENAAAGGEMLKLDIFPKGLFLIAFDEDQDLGQRIIQSVSGAGYPIVDDPTIYDAPNHGGMILMSEMGATTSWVRQILKTLIPCLLTPDKSATGRVRQLLKTFTAASFTTEYCDVNLDDATPDAERTGPQRAAIRGMLPRL